jgi:hypothetical protein
VLFILISVSWLAMITFVAAACRAAALEDDGYAREKSGQASLEKTERRAQMLVQRTDASDRRRGSPLREVPWANARTLFPRCSRIASRRRLRAHGD